MVVSFYLSLVTAFCLEEIGAQGPTLVEGPFARNSQYVDMLQAATGRPVLLPSASGTGTSIGAALLAMSNLRPTIGESPEPKRAGYCSDNELSAYAAAWRQGIG